MSETDSSKEKEFAIVEDGVAFKYEDLYYGINMTQVRDKETKDLISSIMTVMATKNDPFDDSFEPTENDTMVALPLNEGLVIKLIDILLGFKDDYSKPAEQLN